jgi:hypothetical protein
MAVGIDSNELITPIRIMPPAILRTPEMRLVASVAAIIMKYNMNLSSRGKR